MTNKSKRYGNRKAAGANKTEAIRARVRPELKKRLQDFSSANDIELAKFLREAAEFYLTHLESGGERIVKFPEN